MTLAIVRSSALEVTAIGQMFRDALKVAQRSLCYFGLFPFRWQRNLQAGIRCSTSVNFGKYLLSLRKITL
ncbi:hypothetical protein [Nostoc commune]|uniref:hypothetical protein n=1 Tax=Nostoc commune TaxID=1178 RepID=UPI00225DEC62|nr:hypothetical protein [Nostoc commune]